MSDPPGAMRTLADLVADPSHVEVLPEDDVADVLAELERLKARLWVRLARPHVAANVDDQDPEVGDRMLTVEEASEILGVDSRWLYDRSDSLPFAKKLAPRTLRFSERGIYRWLETRP